MKAGRQYEIFTKRLFKTLTAMHPGVEVKHDEVVGNNQIDVLYSFNLTGFNHKTIVECKEYNRNVPLECYRNLVYCMDKLKAKGILVTTEGFQSGVKLEAEQRAALFGDIQLLKVNFVESEGPPLEMNFTGPTNLAYVFDQITTTPAQFRYLSECFNNRSIYDCEIINENGDHGGYFSNIAEELPLAEVGRHSCNVSDGYVKLPNGERVRLSVVHYTIKNIMPFNFHGINLRATIVTATVEDVLTGQIDTYNVDDDF